MVVMRIVGVVALLVAAWLVWDGGPRVIGQSPACLVATQLGDVLGVDRGASCEFRGVPFARPPLDDLRWARPVPAGPWAPAVLNATATPPLCPQLNRQNLPAGSEDCLKLNVWAPRSGAGTPRPVIVWFHPGSFVASTGFSGAHNAARFVELTDAVVVAPNYRLGPLGFLGHRALRTEHADYGSAGNYGMLDQRLALEWVRANIAAFGGDPNRITIAGQSAGGLSVSLHLVSPRSDGLFERAVMQGGFASYRWRTREDGEAQADAFASALGCIDPAEMLACLRGKTRDQILGALPTGAEQFSETARTHWGPLVDGLEIPDQPRMLFELGAFSRVPILIGSNRDEGWTWVNRSYPDELTDEQYRGAVVSEFGGDAETILDAYPAATYGSEKNALSSLVNDAEYACGADRLSRLIERTGTPVFLYQFHHAPGGVVPGRAPHGLDVHFLFNTQVGFPILQTSTYSLQGSDLDLFVAMARYWRQFSATGDPNTYDDTLHHWPAFNRTGEGANGGHKYLVLNLPVKTGKRLRESACRFWEPYFFRSITAAVPAHTP